MVLAHKKIVLADLIPERWPECHPDANVAPQERPLGGEAGTAAEEAS